MYNIDRIALSNKLIQNKDNQALIHSIDKVKPNISLI